jgi:hypothetical protein
MDARLPVVVWCGNITQKSAFLFDPCTPRNPLPVFLLLRAGFMMSRFTVLSPGSPRRLLVDSVLLTT